MSDPSIQARYAYTRRLARSRWAWEFLRRNPEFLADARRHGPCGVSRRQACHQVTLLRPDPGQAAAARWGLLFYPDPDRDGLDADLFWNPALYAGALRVHVAPRAPEERCEIFEETTRLCRILHLTDLAGREHLRLSAGDHVLQVACEGLSLLSPEPVRIQIVIDGVSGLGAHLRFLDRTRRLLAPAPPRSWTRASRALCHALMALDCHQAGLSHQETAKLIYGADRAAPAWADPNGAMRAEIRRAIRKGLHYMNGGYTDLLGAPAALSQAA